jgi:S-adenosylmethionine decarboxylase
MTTGTEWLVDAAGCRPDALRDLDSLRGICARIISELELRVVGEPAWHQFPWPGGVTGLYLLTESHLACHTYPELGVATFNLYCCRSRPPWPWEERLRDLLGATRVTVRCIARQTGMSAPPSQEMVRQAFLPARERKP